MDHHPQNKTVDVRIRTLKPADIPIVKNLCQEWFPIRYPDAWYEEISLTEKFLSFVAEIDGQVVGLLVAEIKLYSAVSLRNFEDYGLLPKTFENVENIHVVYILTLGVISNLRRHGIASLLVKNLIKILETDPAFETCKAIYLHVLTTNTVAIKFYDKLKFRQFKYLPLYYSINQSACDGFSYVLYINGGWPPFQWSLLIDPKEYLSTIKILFANLCTYTVSLVKSHRIRCLSLILITLRPYKYLKKIFNNIMFAMYRKCSNSEKVKSHIYAC